jgi:hypothetical protein
MSLVARFASGGESMTRRRRGQPSAWLMIHLVFFVFLVIAWIAGTISNRVEQWHNDATMDAPVTLILPTPCYTATARAELTATVEGVPKPTPYGTKAVYCWEKKK